MKTLRRHRRSINSALALLLASWQIGQPLNAATIQWTAASEANFNWAEATNWSAGVPTAADDAIFSYLVPNPGSLASPEIVQLSAGSLANSLRLAGIYALTGGDLSLTSGGIRVEQGITASIASLLTGAGGLQKTGNGVLQLLGNNSYTGNTLINNGVVIISTAGALGADPSAVTVSGNSSRGTLGGGSLVIGSSSNNLTGTTFGRSLSLTGGALTGDGAALVSVGSNTFSGNWSTGQVISGANALSGVLPTSSNTLVASASGTTTVNGDIALGGSVAATTTFGGNANWIVNGNISGLDNLTKTGDGLLVLNGNNSFAGILTHSGGFLRVSSGAALGASNNAGAITLGGGTGTLELRSDNPDFSTRRVTMATSATGTILADRAIGGSGLNQTVTLNILTLTAGSTTRTLALNSRNGYRITFAGNSTGGNLGGDNTISISGNGLTTFQGTFWNNTSTTARTLTMTVNTGANAIITSNVIASGADHILTKGGAGNLTIDGTASTFSGVTNINAGTLTIRDFRAINDNAALINIGATTTGATLAIGTANAATAAGLDTNKVLVFAGTTGSPTILANQTFAAPVIFADTNPIAVGAGTKTLTLGGTSMQNNEIRGVLQDNSSANILMLAKTGNGTWLLTGANTFSGSSQINNGTLRIRDTFSVTSRNVLNDAVGIGFTAAAAGIGTAGGIFEYLGANNSTSSETVGPLMAASGAGTIRVTAGTSGSATLTLASVNTVQTTTAASTASTTITVASTAGLVPGMRLTGGSAAATISSITNGTQIVVSAAQTLGSGVALTFDRPNGGGTINFDPGAGANVVIGTVPAVGMLNSYSFFNGTDFAYAPGTTNATLRAPLYDGSDPGFVTSGAALTANSHNLVGGNTSTGAVTVNSLKINGASTPVVTQTGLLTVRSGAAGTPGAILVTGGTATLAGSGGVSTGGAADLIIRVNGASDVLNLNTPVTSTTTGGLTKVGAGTLVIGALNNHTTGGSTNLLEGTIQLTTGGRLSANSVNLVMRQGTILDLNGISTSQSATTASIGAFNGTGTVTNSSATPVTFAVGGGTTGGTGTWNGTINQTSGVINVIKMGTTNSQTWNGISNYTGSTTIGVPGTGTTGSLSVFTLANIGFNSSIGRGDNTSTATNQGSLIFGGTTGGLTYVGDASVSTDRLFTLAGTAAGAGATITNNGINNATVIFSNINPIAITGLVNQTLTMAGSSTGDNQFNPQIVNPSGFITNVSKSGAGLWILGNEDNSYTGLTTISGGMLRAQHGSTLPEASPLVIAGGVFESSGTLTRPLAATATAGSGTVTWGAGNGGFSAANNDLTVNLGGSGATLTWNSGGFVQGNLVFGSATTLGRVDFQNGIDLSNAARIITVTNNTGTAANSTAAIISGIITGSGSGGTAFTKNGNGVLILTGENTYVGDTIIGAGRVEASHIGSAASAISNFGSGSGAIRIGSGTTTGTLSYVGAGETSDRPIYVNGTANASTTVPASVIEANGTGALILSNVVNMAVGTAVADRRTLFLRGESLAFNEITNDLADNGPNAVLNITKDTRANWVLSGDNTYTGTTTISLGAMGFRNDGTVASGPFGVGTLIISNGGIFALDGDRSLAQQVRLSANASSLFYGDYSITLGNVFTNTGGNTTVVNNIADGKQLVINSPTLQGQESTTARTIAFRGSGETILNSSIPDSTGGAAINFSYDGYGSLVLGGPGRTSSYSGTTTLTTGILRIGENEVIPSGAGKGNMVINPGAGLSATFDLNGYSQTINGLTANTLGSIAINNSGTTSATWTFGANDQAVNFLGEVLNTGAGALSLVKTGSATALLTGGPFGHKGATSVLAGSMTIGGELTATTSLHVADNSTLNLTGAFLNPDLVTSISVGKNGTLNLQNGAGSEFDGLTSLTLGGTGGSITELFINAGTGATDSFVLTAGGTLNLFTGNQIRFNINDSGLEGNTSYVLVDATAIGGGLTSGPLGLSDWLLNGPGGFESLSLTTDSTNNQIILRTGNLITGSWFWNSGNAAWNSSANWVDAKSGGIVRASAPGAGSDVIFVSDAVSTGTLTTTLEQNFKVNSLRFEASTIPANTPASVVIETGTLATSRLEVAPQVATGGVAITSGGPTSVNIKTPFRLGSHQTWSVADTGSTLTFEGSLSGEKNVTKTGAGKVVLLGVADPSFNLGQTSRFTVSEGTLELQNLAALGTTAAGNAANVRMDGGTFLYNGATATLNVALEFNGGTLGVATGNPTFNAPVTVSADSNIFLGDLYVAATGRTIALSGGLTGNGKLTINSVNTVSSGNQITGVLTMNGNNSTWTGGFDLLRGDVRTNNANGFGSGLIRIELGKVAFQGFNSVTHTYANPITIGSSTSASVGEINVDNTSGTVSLPFNANFTGTLTLGGAGGAAEMRLFQADNVNSIATFSGGVVLANNASIIVRDAATAEGHITSTGISETGTPGRVLSVNVNPTWSGTLGTLHIAAASSYTGGTILGSGRLRFGHKDAIGTGTLTISGGTLASSTNLTGANKVPNAMTLAAALTFDGANSLEIGGAVDFGAVARTLTVSGTSGAEFILSGALNNLATADGAAITLAGNATSTGVIAGGINMTGDLADLTVSSGNWIHRTGTSRIGDDVTLTGATSVLTLESGLFQVRDDFTVTANAVLNLSGTSALSFNVTTLSADASLRATAGGIINLGADNAVVATEFDGLRIGVDADGVGTLNMGTYSQTVTEFILGNRQAARVGIVNGTGTLTVSGNLDLYQGTINANLASTGSTAFEKIGLGTVTLRGNNSGLNSTGATIVYAGTLALDYTVSNTDKIRALSALDMRGGTLQILGNATTATSQSVNGMTLANLGESSIIVNAGTGQDAVLNLGSITRAASAGNVRFVLPAGVQTDTHGITTTTGTDATGLLGSGTAYATVDDGTGVWFAGKSGNNIVALASMIANDISLWAAGNHVTSSGTGFTGTIGDETKRIASLRFDSASGGAINLLTGGVLDITSGGVLVTSNYSSGALGFFGGQVRSENGEFVIINDSTQEFEISSVLGRDLRVTKGGSGTLVLSGENALAGELQINAGTVRLAGGNAINDRARVVLSLNNANTTLQLTANETIGRLEGGRASTAEELGVVNVGSHHLIINQSDFDGSANENFIFDGKFVGSGVITKRGDDYLTLRGASLDFTGTFNVENGRLDLQGGLGRLSSATAYNIGAGGVILARQDQSSTIDRLSNSAPITLNNTAGTTAITGREGLWLYNTQNGTRTETVGTINLGAGHNAIRNEPQNTGTSTLSDLLVTEIVRENRSTVVVNGLSLGATSGRRARIRFAAGGQATMEADEVGNGSGSGTQFKIIPYIIGAVTTGGVGNSFVTHVDGTTGLRPLANTEYVTNAAGFNGLAGASADNVRFDANPGAALTGTATSINSLVIDGGAAITLDGPASGLEITSGALLAAQNFNHSIQGFTSIITGGGRDYTIYNTGTGTFTIASALTSAVPLVKSGQGVLALTHAGNAFTDVYLNQGFVLADSYNKLGTGGLYFYGGGLRLDAGFADDLGAKAMFLGTGGGTIDTNNIAAVATNLALSGAGEFRKAGAQTLTIGDSNAITNTGRTVVAGGTLLLNNTLGEVINSSGVLITGTTNPTVLRLGQNNQIADAALVSITTSGSNNHLFDVNDKTETIGSLNITSTTTAGGTVRTGATGVLTVNGDITLNNDRTTGDSGTTEFQVLITGSGSVGTRTTNGVLDLAGGVRRITVETIQTNQNFRNDAVIETVIQNGGIIKEGRRALYLRAANTYAGGTTVLEGTLVAANTSGSATGLGSVLVGRDASLAGNGIIAPSADNSITINGTLLVGGVNNAAQQLTITTTGTGLTTVNGVVAFDLFGGQGSGLLNGQAGNNDQLVVGGSSGFTIGSGSTLQVSTSLPIDGTWVAGTEWKLFDWSGLTGGVTGTFENLSDPAPFNYVNLPDLSSIGLAWDVSNLYTQGTIMVVVPEPSRMLLLFLGMMGLFYRRRR